MGATGYPLLLATGETADGVSHLVDRQHPHDLFMELAATYSRNITANSSVFVYAGLPGEPALGPPAFMHRTSGMDNPEAPISHHWLDSTHITFGVVTAGIVLDNWKFEASTFRGREPDQYRYDIEQPALDSFAGRVSWNPVRELSLQVSYGHLNSPEQLEPAVNENRLTASAIYTTPFGDGHLWSTTAAWGRKMLSPGNSLDAYLLESSAILKNNWTLFMRAERVAENELTHRHSRSRREDFHRWQSLGRRNLRFHSHRSCQVRHWRAGQPLPAPGRPRNRSMGATLPVSWCSVGSSCSDTKRTRNVTADHSLCHRSVAIDPLIGPKVSASDHWRERPVDAEIRFKVLFRENAAIRHGDSGGRLHRQPLHRQPSRAMRRWPPLCRRRWCPIRPSATVLNPAFGRRAFPRRPSRRYRLRRCSPRKSRKSLPRSRLKPQACRPTRKNINRRRARKQLPR